MLCSALPSAKRPVAIGGWVPLLPQKLLLGKGGLQGLDGEACLVLGFNINSSIQSTGFNHVLLHDFSQ